MHTVELLAEGLDAVTRLDYRIRRDWLDGQSGGTCEVHGEKWLLLDVASDYSEQLDVVTSALRNEADVASLTLSDDLIAWIDGRRAA